MLNALLSENDLDGVFTEADIHTIAYEAPHRFRCWSDFPPVLPTVPAWPRNGGRQPAKCHRS
jgi:hypothetical protein